MIRLVSSVQNNSISNSGQELSLVLSFSLKGFSILLFSDDKTVFRLDDYTIDAADPDNSDFQNIFRYTLNEYLEKSEYNINLSFAILNCVSFTPVPSELFAEEKQNSLLSFVNDHSLQPIENVDIITSNEKIQLLCQKIPWQCSCIKSLNKNMTSEIDVALFVKTILNSVEAHHGVYVNVGVNQFDLLILENNKMLMLNRFSFTTSKDFCYFLVASVRAAGLEPSEINLNLAGEILPDSEISVQLGKYFSRIEFIKTPGILIPEGVVHHRYFIQFALL